MITIVDYGMGNHGSIQNMLRKLGVGSVISSDPEVVARADKIILPGVGAFDAGMERLEGGGLRQALDDRVLGGRVPVLGICLGMQLMTNASSEGRREGLGWIDANTIRLTPTAAAPKVPHMGWNEVIRQKEDPLLHGIGNDSRFYFVHSYHVCCASNEHVLLTTSYGVEFVSAVHLGNVRGVQFHPEKSHRFGLQLLRNFIERC